MAAAKAEKVASRLAAATVSLCALVGASGAVVALNHRGGAGELSAAQGRALTASPPRTVAAGSVQGLVGKAPEPVLPGRRTPLAGVRCAPGKEALLRNPWSCRLRYRSGTLAHYRVVVQPDGRYVGLGSGVIEGCCVQTPLD
jgi:hypothetical protein